MFRRVKFFLLTIFIAANLLTAGCTDIPLEEAPPPEKKSATFEDTFNAKDTWLIQSTAKF